MISLKGTQSIATFPLIYFKKTYKQTELEARLFLKHRPTNLYNYYCYCIIIIIIISISIISIIIIIIIIIAQIARNKKYIFEEDLLFSEKDHLLRA